MLRDVSKSVGLSFTHFNGATSEAFLPEIMGSGAVLFDYDNDGDLDVYLVQGSRINETTPLLFPETEGDHSSRLFRNQLVPDGKLAFEEVTEAAGLAVKGYGMGAATGDLDDDGDLDLYLSNLGPDALYLNNGDGTFSDGSATLGEGVDGWSTSVDFLDFDVDGNLDVVVARYVEIDREIARACHSGTGKRDYCTPDIYRPHGDTLLKGDGKGGLEVVATWQQPAPAASTGLGVSVADFNNDHLPDIYVANDKRANQLWLNRGDGRFEDVAVLSGVALNGDGKEEASMGVTSADVDVDGDDDIFVTHLKGETNTLYLNQGNAAFFDGTLGKKLAASSVPSTGFGTRWFDLENDGDLDLFVANGAVMMEPSQSDKEPFPYLQWNQLFRNDEGFFADVSTATGLHELPREIGRGAAFGDVDNDGDIDILVSNNHGPARLLLNESPNKGDWIGIRLHDEKGNRNGIGARVGAERYDGKMLWRRVTTGDSYLSASDIRTHIGLGELQHSTLDVLVVWPGGQTERWSNVPVNAYSTLERGTGTLVERVD